jgi:hypothetical protein
MPASMDARAEEGKGWEEVAEAGGRSRERRR